MDENILTTVEDLGKMLEDKEFNEFEDDVNAILIKEIKLGEIIPEDELKEETHACDTCD
jgi:hypothetical protein